VLFFLIPIAWLAVIYFGLMMCRLAGHSDRLHAAALAEWIRTSYFAGSGKLPSEDRAGRGVYDAPHRRHRATG
jgi:hypothetical protein